MGKIGLVDPNAAYDETKEAFTLNQRALARASFELGQAIRREKAATDADSPGKLTPMEILSNIALKSPGIIDAYVNLQADAVNDVKDAVAVGYLTQAQLLVELPDEA